MAGEETCEVKAAVFTESSLVTDHKLVAWRPEQRKISLFLTLSTSASWHFVFLSPAPFPDVFVLPGVGRWGWGVGWAGMQGKG